MFSNKKKLMSQNLQDQVEHIDFTDYWSDIKKDSASAQSDVKKEEAPGKSESEKQKDNKQKYSKAGKKRCKECEKCDLDPDCCNHEKDFLQ